MYPESCRLTPFAHQVVGTTEWLAKQTNPPTGRIYPGCVFLADEMGAGKTKQFIDAAQLLFNQGAINKVIVVVPASVRFVWVDENLGELAKHLWVDTPSMVWEYHAKTRCWAWLYPEKTTIKRLHWFITNYEFLRSEGRLGPLLEHAGPLTYLALDESSAVKSHSSDQTKASMKLRKSCGWVTLFNGTPIANHPGDLYSQSAILDPRILGCKNYYHFRARYAIMGGWQRKEIVSWRNLEDLQQRMGPYVLRRLKADCLDLPEKLPPVTLSVPLEQKTWKLYLQMRDEFVAWLNGAVGSISAQAGVRAMRLAQLTSGFLGGVMDFSDPMEPQPLDPQEVGQEKLNLSLDWLEERLDEYPSFKLLVWCRFRPELDRLANSIVKRFKIDVGRIWGGQHKDERGHAIRLLSPETATNNPAVVVGTPGSGSVGLNLTAAAHVLYVSNDYRLMTRLQSADRVHRSGQTRSVWYGDIIATGPSGQKTIDHVVIKALRDKENLANWTTSAWIKELSEEV